MKTFAKFAMLTLMVLALAASGFSQVAPATAKALNLERGVVGPVNSNTGWSGYSSLNRIPGAGLIPNASKTTAFYLGFTAGTQADVNNMTLYTTARGGTTITAVTPVTLGGISNPSIALSSSTVCPSQPLTAGVPCIIRLDPLTLTLSALNDYYLVVYFTSSDNNNGQVGATQAANSISSLNGWFINSDQSRLTVGSSIPSGCCSTPYFLLYVMTD